jgi:hypothetical protein
MGLDQSFYKDKETQNEVLYFRKFHALQSEIGEILKEQIENGKTYRLQPEDLIKLRDYLATEGLHEYWAYDTDEPSDSYFHALGVLSYYIGLNKPLWYNGDW